MRVRVRGSAVELRPNFPPVEGFLSAKIDTDRATRPRNQAPDTPDDVNVSLDDVRPFW